MPSDSGVLLKDTQYAALTEYLPSMRGSQIYNERNLVILSLFEILEHRQYKHFFAPAIFCRTVTAVIEKGANHKRNHLEGVDF